MFAELTGRVTSVVDRLGAWLENRLVRILLLILAAVSGIIAIWVAFLAENWRTLRDSLTWDRPAQVAFWLVLALVLFVLGVSGKAVLNAVVWLAVIVAYGALSWIFVGGHTALPTDRSVAAAFGGISVGFLVAIAAVLLRREGVTTIKWRDSSGSVVLLLWSAVVLYAIAFVAALVFQADGQRGLVCSDRVTADCIDESAWGDYLILLGLPGAAAAVAKSKGHEALDQPSETTSAITELQYFVFNSLAVLVVLGNLWQRGVLGEVPDVLLAVTGASALTYALVKRVPAAW